MRSMVSCMQGDVAVGVERIVLGAAAHGVEPADFIRIAFDQAGVGDQRGIQAFEGAVHHGKDAGRGLESLDGADLLTGFDRAAMGHGKTRLHQFAEHAGGELGEPDAPDRRDPPGWGPSSSVIASTGSPWESGRRSGRV